MNKYLGKREIVSFCLFHPFLVNPKDWVKKVTKIFPCPTTRTGFGKNETFLLPDGTMHGVQTLIDKKSTKRFSSILGKCQGNYCETFARDGIMVQGIFSSGRPHGKFVVTRFGRYCLYIFYGNGRIISCCGVGNHNFSLKVKRQRSGRIHRVELRSNSWLFVAKNEVSTECVPSPFSLLFGFWGAMR